MNPVAFAMTGLAFGLWLNAMNLLGVSSDPVEEGASPPAKAVGIAGSLTAAITLIISSIWLFVGAPFGDAVIGYGLFSGIMGMYGLMWIGVFAVQVFGVDARPVGDLCLLMAIMQIIYIIGYAQMTGMATAHDWLVNLVLASYTVLLFMFWRLLNGKFPAKPTGVWAMITVIGTLYLLFFSGDIFPTP